MTIPYFAADQNDVFIPALLWLLVVAVLVCLPIVFAQTLRRTHRTVPVVVTAVVLAAAALVVFGWQTGVAFRKLGDERARVQADIAQRYGLHLTGGEVGELVDGGKPQRTLPDLAAASRLLQPTHPHPLHLVAEPKGSDTYVLTFGGKPWPR